MTDSYFQSISDKDTSRSILNLDLPTYRQAYSDRTAWVMSVLSELAYIKFNPLFKATVPASEDGKQGEAAANKPEYIKAHFIQRITKMIDADRAELLSGIIDKVLYNHEEEQARLNAQLSEFDFKIIKVFDKGGTQAILVQNKEYMVLAFRGTETDSLDDIKADARANIRKCETQGMIHSGFYFAYQEIRLEVEQTLLKSPYCNKPLYITGHSLGGALATVATKFIYHKGGLSACYTFGSPRVGNDDWINNIKTPIHRLVNAADCVTMLPPGDVTVTILATIAKIIPGAGERAAAWLQAKFGGYMHAGNMRYLTNCNPGDFDDVKVLYTVSFFYRIKALVYKSLPFSKLLADHSISTYSKKLMIIAFKRNKAKMLPDDEKPKPAPRKKRTTSAAKPAEK
ncbi:lipase family protein [Glaciecola sp. SC05]|uniref:lipase family protein n=1 Tax=Glaciecola sp. SC05 TaxID=1987355 RepID=UPI00352995C4